MSRLGWALPFSREAYFGQSPGGSEGVDGGMKRREMSETTAAAGADGLSALLLCGFGMAFGTKARAWRTYRLPNGIHHTRRRLRYTLGAGLRTRSCSSLRVCSESQGVHVRYDHLLAFGILLCQRVGCYEVYRPPQ